MAAGAREEGLRRVVAGMLSTTDFKPTEVHPDAMLPMADLVIHHVRLMDSEASQPEGPIEGQDARY